MAIYPPIASMALAVRTSWLIGMLGLTGCAPLEGYSELAPFAACQTQCEAHGDLYRLDFGRGLCVCGNGERFVAESCDPEVSSCVSYLDLPGRPSMDPYGYSGDRARWAQAVRELESIEALDTEPLPDR